ncbi:hypothetical protein CTI12_AA319580 [Artemisia annua]|uniref:Uncharacterized protein n=1 Tax=Artemisia annua TaxID=35608 RepID=A0A2U1N156_ARTAN|nr:hypothetical protein CTI12_AA319580 [Artemisia annua]
MRKDENIIGKWGWEITPISIKIDAESRHDDVCQEALLLKHDFPEGLALRKVGAHIDCTKKSMEPRVKNLQFQSSASTSDKDNI